MYNNHYNFLKGANNNGVIPTTVIILPLIPYPIIIQILKKKFEWLFNIEF
jgi:hypothetical protein